MHNIAYSISQISITGHCECAADSSSQICEKSLSGPRLPIVVTQLHLTGIQVLQSTIIILLHYV